MDSGGLTGEHLHGGNQHLGANQVLEAKGGDALESIRDYKKGGEDKRMYGVGEGILGNGQDSAHK